MRGRSPVPVGGLVSASPGGGVPVAYNPAVTWPGNTIVTIGAVFVHSPGLLSVWGSFQETAGVAVALLTVPLPPGFSAQVGSSILAGAVARIDGTTIGWNALKAGSGATVVTADLSGAAASVGTWGYFFSVPVNG